MSSCGHTCTHLGILIAGEVAEKQELKNLLMWGEFSFHAMLDRKIVNGAVWSNSLIFLIRSLFGITYLESMSHLRRNQVVDLHKQKLRIVPSE